MSLKNHIARSVSPAVFALGAILACERNKLGDETGTSATTGSTETTGASGVASTGTAGTSSGVGSETGSSSGGASSPITDTTLMSTTQAPHETTGTSSETCDTGSSTGSQTPKGCETRLTEEACHVDNREGSYEICLWVSAVTWETQDPCPDLATGVGLGIHQDYTDDCSSTGCTPKRVFFRPTSDDTYEAFAHPQLCGTPTEFSMCSSGAGVPICTCFGCDDPGP